MATFLSFAGAAWWCVAVAFFCATLCFGVAQPFVQRRRATATDKPPVSVILPIKCLDPGFDSAQRSVFTQAYPDYEVLISAAEEQSPALDAARRLAAAYPDVPSRFVRSWGGAAVSPKLDNLIAPIAQARRDLIVTKDSNITLGPRALADFIANFAPGVGLVVGVPVAVRPETLAARIEAALINAHARLLLSASVLGVGFGVGKIMAFRRSDLDRAGGVAALSENLAEDTALASAFGAIGLKTVFSHQTVAQEIGPRSLADVYHRQVRWSVIRRANEGLSYPLEPLASPLPAGVAAALAAPLAGVSAFFAFSVTLAAWFLAETAFAAIKGWEISVWSPLAFLGREALALAAWLRGWTTHEVTWASQRFDARQGPGRRSKQSAEAPKN